MTVEPPPLEELNGQVTAILARRGEFIVAEFLADSQGPLKIVGELPGVEVGQRLTLHGYETEHPRHGPQFRVEYYHTLLEHSRAGITSFFEKEVHGVGPTIARRIVGHFWHEFGGELLEALEAQPQRLTEVSGIGRERAAKIAASLHESFSLRRVMLDFYELGLTPGLARRVVRTYEAIGEDPVAAVLARPYDLTEMVDGIGFARADAIARRRGFPLDAPERLTAAVRHILHIATRSDGHCFLPRAEIIRRGRQLLWSPGVPTPRDSHLQLNAIIETLIQSNTVQVEMIGGQEALYPSETWWSEHAVVRHLRRLLESPLPRVTLFEQDPANLRRAAEARAGIALAPGQVLAFDTTLSQGVVIITGGPGTGKSTLARLLVDVFQQARFRIKLAAPTGRAARRLAEVSGQPATTIHRLLEWQEGGFTRDEDTPLEADVVLIDESSMLDIFLARDLLAAIPSGCRLVLVGDVDQLPAVGPGNVLRDLIESGQVPVAKLDRIFRQNTAQPNMIVDLAHAINHAPRGARLAPPAAATPTAGNVFVFDITRPLGLCTCGAVRSPDICPVCEDGTVAERFPSPAEAGAALIEDLVARRIPHTFAVDPSEIQVLAPTYKGAMGVTALNARLRARLNPERPNHRNLRLGERDYRVGDRVMATRNLPQKDVVNGLLGVVTAVIEDDQELLIAFEGEVAATFDAELAEFLVHAYAVTCHKSQGAEFRIVVLALDMSAPAMLYRQLLYTAITRAREALILVTNPAAFHRAVANNRPKHRWTGLAARLSTPPPV
ncbi:MAG: AAA family ATPase [Ardenticatenaceae bacterium]|nr:AAA family ATPase [Ardenticatenaceae bacterium]HBY98319.1 ATP-dependent RecD-like DNA helicase [Chloroflexota bacterium]